MYYKMCCKIMQDKSSVSMSNKIAAAYVQGHALSLKLNTMITIIDEKPATASARNLIFVYQNHLHQCHY